MNPLTSLYNRRVKYVLFVILCCLISGISFNTFARTTLEEKLYNQEHWREIYGDPPEWCTMPDDPNLAVVCGRVLSGKPVKDPNGNYIPNIPLEHVRVEVWEQNPTSPSGKLLGQLSNVFDSTSTNSDGRFQINMRKVGPPNKLIYLIFKCGTELQKPRQLDSWHDYWNIDFQVGCPWIGATYAPPENRQSLVEGLGGFLGCEYNRNETVITGMEKREQPTVNNIVESENFDHRHTINTFGINLGVNVPLPGGAIWSPNISFVSPGGWWEADCLVKDNVGTWITTGNGTEYICGVQNCTWPEGSQIGDDTTVCDGGRTMYSSDAGVRDRLTRPFYNFIPKMGEMLPYRRLDLRANITDYMEDPVLPATTTAKLWGSGIIDPIGNPFVFLRPYLADNTADTYISCAELKKRNMVVDTYPNGIPQKNKQLNGGPLGGLAPESDDWEDIYNSIVNCDPTVTDRELPGYCNIRNPQEPVCNDYLGGRTEANNSAVRFCDIQPPFGDTRYCSVGDGNCGGQCGAGATTTYIFDKTFFNTEMMFANGPTALNLQSNVFNDSIDQGDTVYRSVSFNPPFNRETELAHRADTGVLNKDGKQKGNSKLTMDSILKTDDYVDGTESFSDPLTSPFTNGKDDYEDLSVWKIYEFGAPQAFCGLGYPFDFNVITGPLTEAIGTIHPDNIFPGNNPGAEENPLAPSQVGHKSISTTTWYMDQNAIDRDSYLMDDGLVSGAPLIGLGGGVGPAIDALLITMPARDVFDSVLSMIHGDGQMHNFQFSLANVISAADGLTNEREVKTFGDRFASMPDPMNKPYYEVEHILNETNFMFLPGRNPPLQGPNGGPGGQGIFVLPPVSDAIDALGIHGNTPDGEALMPNDWTDTTVPPASCYPFEGNEIMEDGRCDSYREAVPYDTNSTAWISRTCRLDTCSEFYLERHGTCRCDYGSLLTGDCTITNDNVDDFPRERDCETNDRIYCAEQQETTLRYRLASDAQRSLAYPPAVIVPGNGPVDAYLGVYDDQYDPPEFDDGDCELPAGTTYQDIYDAGGFIENSISTTGTPKRRCDVTRAGPMIGTAECNGTLEVSDFAVRVEQRPRSPANNQPYKELDAAKEAALKITAALAPPLAVPIDGTYKGFATTSNTDTSKDIQEGLYTALGAEFETTGYGNNSQSAQYATTPVQEDKSVELNDLFFHCRANFPLGRGELDTSMYTNDDPDRGAVDDNGDGVFGSGDNGWVCPAYNVPSPEWVEYTNTTGDCSVSDINRCLANGAVPDNLPRSFFDTINMAANTVRTPAGAIIAVLATEAGFAVPSGYWGDEFKVQMWSRPWYGKYDGGGSTQCDDNVWSPQGPFQILQSSQIGLMQDPAVIGTFESIAAGRSRSATRCNFLDSAIMAAYILKQTSGPVTPPPASGVVTPQANSNLGSPGVCGPGYDAADRFGAYSGGSYSGGATTSAVGIYSDCN